MHPNHGLHLRALIISSVGTAQVLSTHLRTLLTMFKAAHTSTPTKRKTTGVSVFSEELDCAEVVAWDRVTSSSISDFRFILVLYRLEPTINDADPVE